MVSTETVRDAPQVPPGFSQVSRVQRVDRSARVQTCAPHGVVLPALPAVKVWIPVVSAGEKITGVLHVVPESHDSSACSWQLLVEPLPVSRALTWSWSPVMVSTCPPPGKGTWLLAPGCAGLVVAVMPKVCQRWLEPAAVPETA